MKKKKTWVKVLVIVLIIIVLLVVVGLIFAKKLFTAIEEESKMFWTNNIEEYEIKEEHFENYIRKTGNITSFDIQTINVEGGAKVTETYALDGSVVAAKQRLLRISDGYNAAYINAPISGMFFISYTEQGARLYQVYNLDEIGVELYVPERDVVKLSVGQKATIRVLSLNKEFEGSISFISKLPSNGLFKIQVKIPYNEEIRFGYNTSVKITISESDNVIVVPYDMVYMSDDNRYYVVKKEYKEEFVMHNGELDEKYRTYVEIGNISNNQVEILSGLNIGDVIVG